MELQMVTDAGDFPGGFPQPGDPADSRPPPPPPLQPLDPPNLPPPNDAAGYTQRW